MSISRRALLQSPALAALQPRAPHILLISGWNLYNIGDVAITPGFLRLVQQHWPEARVTMLAATYPNEIGAYLQPKFPELEVIPMEFQAGKALSPAFEKVFQSGDLLVLNSGMTLSYGYYGLEWNSYIPRILAFMRARQLKIPYGVYAHSFDRVEPHADVLYSDVLSTAAFVYTRDSESLKLLQSKGVRCPEMAFAPDSTFGFDLRNEERAAQFLNRHSLEPGRFLAFIPRLDANRFSEDGKEKVHAAQTRELIIRWVRETNTPVALVPEVQKGLELARVMVYDQLPADIRRMVRFQPDYWMPDEAQAVYAKASLVVSAEMHSIILALAAGTPAIHPHFMQAGLKQWMMRDISLPFWLHDQDKVSVDTILASMIEVHRDPKTAKARVDKAMTLVRRRQSETMAHLRRSAR